jgi:hypothetical protein
MTAYARPLANLANLAATIGIFTVLRPHIDDNGVRGAIAYAAGPFVIESFKILHQRSRRTGSTP